MSKLAAATGAMLRPVNAVLDRGVAKHQERLEEQGIPAPRAAVKAEGTAYGKVAVTAGICLIFAALLMMLALDLNVVSGLLLGAFAALGFVLFGVGFSLISRDAAPVIAKMGEWLVSLVRAVRGKAE